MRRYLFRTFISFPFVCCIWFLFLFTSCAGLSEKVYFSNILKKKDKPPDRKLWAHEQFLIYSIWNKSMFRCYYIFFLRIFEMNQNGVHSILGKWHKYLMTLVSLQCNKKTHLLCFFFSLQFGVFASEIKTKIMPVVICYLSMHHCCLCEFDARI